MNKKNNSHKQPLRHRVNTQLNGAFQRLFKGLSLFFLWLFHWIEQAYDHACNFYAKKGEEEDLSKQLWQLPKALILEELEVRQTFLITSGVISTLLFILIIWANVATIDEMAIATGFVTTPSRIGEIQHLEGGIVKRVYVQEGDLVKKDQLLVLLDDTNALSELREQEAKQSSLNSDIQRFRYSMQHNQPEELENKIAIDLSPSGGSGSTASLMDIWSGDKALLQLESSSQQMQQLVLVYQIAQQKDDVGKLEQQLSLIQLNLKLGKEEFDVYKKLMKKEYISRTEFLSRQRELIQLQNDQVNVEFTLNKARNALKEHEYKLQDLNTTLKKDTVDKLNKAIDELYQVQFTIHKLKDRVNRIHIQSPISGMVNQITIIPGEVIKPSETIMNIVPENEPLQVEAQITPVDIGHVHTGDHAKIKVQAYDYARYGTVSGHVTKLSATTFTDETTKAIYYKGIIKLDKQYIGLKENVLRSGMTCEVNIITGHKTIIEYLLKPIYVNLQGSFHER